MQHDAAETAAGFVAGRTRADLDSDRMLLLALVQSISIIGEAASRLAEATRAASPEIPWRSVIGMRNRIVHAYFDVDPDMVWRTVTEDLPELIPQVKALLERER
jgi:uncharacterized protein with HEPN domain